jgi:hypothetical protein
MSEIPSVPEMPAEPLSWIDTWANALTAPSVANYEEISNQPGANLGKAYAWIALSGVVAYVLETLIQLLFKDSSPELSALTRSLPFDLTGMTLAVTACMAPVVAIGAMISLTINAGFIQFLARLLGGQGSFVKLAFVTSAYLSPLAIITGTLSAIPFVSLVNLPIAIYAIVLNVIAVKSVNRFGWGKAVLASVIIPGGLGLLLFVAAFAVLAALGTAVNSAFSNVLQNMPR